MMLTMLRRAALLSVLPRSGAPAAHLTSAATQHDSAAAQYEARRLHPALFDPDRVRTEWLHPTLVQWLDLKQAESDASALATQGTSEACDASSLVTEEAHEIYSFPLLNERARGALMEEVAHFATTGIEARRPNSMNKYGLILNDIGLRPSLDAVQALVQPLLASLFPVEAARLEGHHSFVVAYEQGKDVRLDVRTRHPTVYTAPFQRQPALPLSTSPRHQFPNANKANPRPPVVCQMHTDDSDVTVNACLGDDFTASGLSFCGYVGAPDHRHLSLRYDPCDAWPSQKQRNKALTLAHAQTIHYTSN